MKELAIGMSVFLVLLTLTLSYGWQQYTSGQHDVAAHFYHHCREELGLFEPMTALAKGHSACAIRIETELGIENRWAEEMP